MTSAIQRFNTENNTRDSFSINKENMVDFLRFAKNENVIDISDK